MTKAIILSVCGGAVAGYLFIPVSVIAVSPYLMKGGLCLLLFLVGMDLGRQGSLLADIRRIGVKVLVIPVAVIAGTLIFSALASFMLPLTMRESLAVGSGFGWYTLAPVILADYSPEISAVSFLHNVMREFFSILLIPVVAKRIGYLETVALPGAAAMDVCLPVVEKTTTGLTAIYSFVSGALISISVPVLVRFFIGW